MPRRDNGGVTMDGMKANRDALCPACGRFIGPQDTCPYCDCPSPKPLSLKVLRLASLALAVLGMALLYLAAWQGRVPAIAVGDVTPAMNSAYIRVGGCVAAKPKTGTATTPYVSFPITDGSNRLKVVAFNRCAIGLIASTNVPGRGAIVEVAGVLSVSGPDERQIVIESPAQLKVIARGPPPCGRPGRTIRPAGGEEGQDDL
ncbi:MAG: hypothetical protein WCL44_00350 [bacterium]